MSDSSLTLKHSTGFFAAGREMAEALALLSDGAFKLYAYVCLYADRHTAQYAQAAQSHRLDEIIPVIGSGHDDDFHSTAECTQRFEHRQAVQTRHSQIEQEHIGGEFLNAIKGLEPVASFTNNFDIFFPGQQHLQGFPNNRVVVSNHHPNALPLSGYVETDLATRHSHDETLSVSGSTVVVRGQADK
jgi:hypothetical protein